MGSCDTIRIGQCLEADFGIGMCKPLKPTRIDEGSEHLDTREASKGFQAGSEPILEPSF